ncbi:MAG: hypothetical protein JXA30_21855 [Deltaproteobacteria bacterium]|nr:hypothetical protein [Deltaproteobacteria bacterium]
MNRIYNSVFLCLAATFLISCSSSYSRENDSDGAASDDGGIDSDVGDTKLSDAGNADTVAYYDGGTDSGVGDAQLSDTGDADSIPPCFDPDEIPTCITLLELKRDSPLYQPQDILFAEQFGSEARFTAMGGLAALAKIEEESSTRWSVAVFSESALEVPANARLLDIEWPEADGDFTVLDVWAEPYAGFPSEVDVVALGCDSSTCVVLGANSASDSELRPLPEMTLPSSLSVKHIIMGRYYDSESPAESLTVCVFGEALLCREENQWVTRIAPEKGVELRDVTLDNPSVAVKDSGGTFVLGDSRWEAIEINSSGALIGVESYYEGFLVIGEEGFLYEATRNSSYSCKHAFPLVAAISYDSFGEIIIIDARGDIYQYTRKSLNHKLQWCKASSLSSMQILDYGSTICGISHNLILLTADRIVSALGFLECAID